MFTEDPQKRFYEDLQRLGPTFQKQLEDEAMRDHPRHWQPALTWDHHYKSLTGEKINILTYAPGTGHLITATTLGERNG